MARRSKKKRGEAAPSRWDRLSGRTQHVVCLLALVVIAFGFFAPVHFTGKSLVATDNVQWRAMAESLYEHQEETAGQVLWAPNGFAGMPAYMIDYGASIPQIDALANALRQVIWPTSHFLFLLLGTYLLVVLVTRNRMAGVFGAVAYGLTTYIPIILIAGHNSKFIALSYAPWLALAFAYVLHRPRFLAALLFAAALALNLRAGHVQITYYFCFLLGVWWIVEAVGALRHGRGKAFARTTGWLALGSLLGLLMVAQPYLANYEYKAFTIRGSAGGAAAEGGLDFSYAMGWSQGWGELITLLIPGAYGGSGMLYWGPKPFTAGPHYVGGIVILLALVAVWRLRRNLVWALGIGTLLAILFSLGSHFLLLNRPMFEYFPLFDAFRVPETWLSAAAFALAVLAAAGIAYLMRSEPSPKAEKAKTRSLYMVSGGLVGVVVLLMVLRGGFFEFEGPQDRQQIARQLVQQVMQQQPGVQLNDPRVRQAIQQRVEQTMTQLREERANRFGSDARRTLLFILLACGILIAYRKEAVPGWVAAAGLVVLVTVDLWGVDRRYFNEDALSSTGGAEEQIATYNFDRFILQRQEEAGGPGRFRVLSLEFGQDPTTNARPAYHYETLNGYHGAKLRLYQDYLDNILQISQSGPPDEQALDLLNTRYIVASQPLPGYEVVYQDDQTGMVVLENPDALPRAFFVGQTEVVSSRENTFERLRSDRFDPRQTALLPEPIDFETTPLDSSSTAHVELQEYAADRITWTVETDAPRLLVVSEPYYPAGWQATIDGEEVPIYRVNHLLRAVPVPEGEHEVVMRFEPLSHKAGVWIAGISTAFVYGGILVLLGLSYVRRRRSEDKEATETPVGTDR